jgi:hypothetical protein
MYPGRADMLCPPSLAKDRQQRSLSVLRCCCLVRCGIGVRSGRRENRGKRDIAGGSEAPRERSPCSRYRPPSESGNRTLVQYDQVCGLGNLLAP